MTIYYINGQWLTYEQAHNLGYTLQPATIINAVKADLTPVDVKKDSGTYYNPELQEWFSDLSTLNVFVKSNDVVLYRGESSITLDGYAANENVESSFVAVNAAIVPVNECYQRFGYTLQPCQDWLMEGGVVTAWFDPETELYWDDREGRKNWSDKPPIAGGQGIPVGKIQAINMDELIEQIEPPAIISTTLNYDYRFPSYVPVVQWPNRILAPDLDIDLPIIIRIE